MVETDLGRLRKARIRVHRVLAKLEPMVEGYRAKLADLEARIYDMAPELRLSARFHDPCPIFPKGSLTRMAITVLREAGEPLPIRIIAVRMLAAKGIPLPDPRTRHLLRKRLRLVFIKLDKRGVTVRVGEGMETRRGLA